jgi:antirestriction protein ArdC
MVEPQVEALIKTSGIDFRIGGNRAYPLEDYVQVPPPATYFEPINWHRTALHEPGHGAVIAPASTAIYGVDWSFGRQRGPGL